MPLNMKTKLTKKAVALFENIKKIDEEGREYWSSRDLWKILEYTENRHFLPVIEKAKVSCENSGHLVSGGRLTSLGGLFCYIVSKLPFIIIETS